MKSFKLVLTLATLAVFASACGGSSTVNTPPQPTPASTPVVSATPPPDPLAEAREYFGDNCESCHQANGAGGPVKIEGKKLNVPALTKGHALGHSDEELAKQISQGGDGMPAFKDKLTPVQIDGLIVYIRKTFQSGAAPPDAVKKESPASLTPPSSGTKK